MNKKFYSEKQKRRDIFQEVGLYERYISIYLRKQRIRMWTGFTGPVTDFCENDHEFSGSIRVASFLTRCATISSSNINRYHGAINTLDTWLTHK
jgi:hypothetical protein